MDAVERLLVCFSLLRSPLVLLDVPRKMKVRVAAEL